MGQGANIYKVDHGGVIVYMEADRPLTDTDAQLLMACAAEIREEGPHRDSFTVTCKAMSKFNGRSDAGLRIVSQPWLATIHIGPKPTNRRKGA